MAEKCGPNFFELERSAFVSDLHLNHYWVNKAGEERGVTLFERTQFRTIQEHDEYIWKQLYSWAEKHPEHTLFILGDFGDTSQLYKLDMMRYKWRIWVIYVYGNHDSRSDYEKFWVHCDEVYLRPHYISDRVIVSHEPIWPVPYGHVNIHGHLHNAVLDCPQSLCASIHVIGYQPFSWKKVCKALTATPKASYKFLEEPYNDHYISLVERDDLVMDKNGKVDPKASIELKKKKDTNMHDWTLHEINGSNSPQFEWIGCSLDAAKDFIYRKYADTPDERLFIAAYKKSDYVVPLVYNGTNHSFGEWC